MFRGVRLYCFYSMAFGKGKRKYLTGSVTNSLCPKGKCIDTFTYDHNNVSVFDTVGLRLTEIFIEEC